MTHAMLPAIETCASQMAASIWGMGTKVKIEFAIGWYMEVLHYQEVAIG